MRNILFSLFAIGVAATAAMMATTAMLNAPHRTAAVTTMPAANVDAPKPAETPPAVPPSGTPAPPGGTPDAGKPATAGGAAAPGTDAAKADEGEDKDPYEGIAPEELPPDLQYNADSSVSFPTNI
ncbi:MAG TPA: hypothetical protein VK624_07560 [Steroidobacteraceae bacterium]|nr:hypothetical protein [Steroidobacteraceae bacterium]